jgi:hypothetical protein
MGTTPTRQLPRQGRAPGKKGGQPVPRRVIALRAAAASALFLLICGRASVWAAECDVPATFGLVVEQRSLTGGGLAVVRARPGSDLHPGDVVKQANGRRTNTCADLEAAAADALAKGLLLLVAAERDGATTAVALAAAPAAVAAAPPAPGVPSAPAARGEPHAVEAPPPPAPVPTATARPHRETPLPERAGASGELAAKTVAAAAVLRTVDEAARFAVPLAVYERRLDDAKNAVGALRLEGQGSDAVRAVIDEAFGYHEAARDVRRWKAAELAQAHTDQRGAGGLSMPYFSDSEVPRWVERYPFLSESLQQAPRTTHMLLPGEMAGRWNPDRAVELLWERAAQTSARLAAWGGGS